MEDKPARFRTPTDSKIVANQSLISKNGWLALIFCFIAFILAIISFWHLNVSPGSMLVITDYFAHIPVGQEKSFGYGGTSPTANTEHKTYQFVDVPFQSRTMSSFCFSIQRKEDGTFWAKGKEDKLLVDGMAVAEGQEIQLNSQSKLKSIGQYGTGIFTVYLDEQPERVRLHLQSPIRSKIISEQTRITFGLFQEIVTAPIDEIFVRTTLDNHQTESLIFQKKDSDRFIVSKDEDLAQMSNNLKVFSSMVGSDTQTGKDSFVETGKSFSVGSVIFRLDSSNYPKFVGLTPVSIFGFKLVLIIMLCALIFGLRGFGLEQAQIRMPYGAVIFGCVALFATVGLSLTARDFLLPPYESGRFNEYSSWLFYSLLVLFFLRIPIHSFGPLKWIWAVFPFLLISTLLNKPFDSFLVFPSIWWYLTLLILFFAGAFFVHYIIKFVHWFIDELVTAKWSRISLIFFVVGLLIIMTAWFLGGRSALPLLGLRIHLPTLLTPLITLGVVLGIISAESEDRNWKTKRGFVIGIFLVFVAIYYLVSHFDHGGTAILGAVVIYAMWLASRKSKPWLLTLLLVVFCAAILYVAVSIEKHERFEIAWGGEDVAQQYFDEAVNLRTARDLARSGGLFGLYEELYIPSSVSTNIYNDLVAAYVAGFFGMTVLGIVAFAYFLLYTRLLFGLLRQSSSNSSNAGLAGQPQNVIAAASSMPPPFSISTSGSQKQRVSAAVFDSHVYRTYGASLTFVFLTQMVWVFGATLWRKIPLSGLDLQPLSASVISIVAFIVILLGSVTFVHNLDESEKILP